MKNKLPSVVKNWFLHFCWLIKRYLVHTAHNATMADSLSFPSLMSSFSEMVQEVGETSPLLKINGPLCCARRWTHKFRQKRNNDVIGAQQCAGAFLLIFNPSPKRYLWMSLTEKDCRRRRSDGFGTFYAWASFCQHGASDIIRFVDKWGEVVCSVMKADFGNYFA